MDENKMKELDRVINKKWIEFDDYRYKLGLKRVLKKKEIEDVVALKIDELDIDDFFNNYDAMKSRKNKKKKIKSWY